MQDQRVVVVGGTSGMGRGVADAARAAGAAVVIAGRRPINEREPLEPPDQHAVVDATRDDSVRALFEGLGPIDHLVVTAAPAPGARQQLLTSDVAEFRRYLDDKLGGALSSARWAAPLLRPGGSITFLTGGAAVKPRAGMVSVAFAAVEALSRALAVELGPLRVNTIRPGFIDSEMWDFLDDEARQKLRDKVVAGFPVHRVGTPGDIGDAAVFLMTSPYVTGAVLEVTGGESLVDVF
jgi:NAD(P)-dependent dehydrogenase (short-subunit alcohol dehydrogenase family)